MYYVSVKVVIDNRLTAVMYFCFNNFPHKLYRLQGMHARWMFAKITVLNLQAHSQGLRSQCNGDTGQVKIAPAYTPAGNDHAVPRF